MKSSLMLGLSWEPSDNNVIDLGIDGLSMFLLESSSHRNRAAFECLYLWVAV